MHYCAILDYHGLPSGYTTSLQGSTLRYLAPELMGGVDPDEHLYPTTKSDVFAFAYTCILILFDHQPYHRWKTDNAVIMAIQRNEAPWKWGDTSLEQVLPSTSRTIQRLRSINQSACVTSQRERPTIIVHLYLWLYRKWVIREEALSLISYE